MHTLSGVVTVAVEGVYMNADGFNRYCPATIAGRPLLRLGSQHPSKLDGQREIFRSF